MASTATKRTWTFELQDGHLSPSSGVKVEDAEKVLTDRHRKSVCGPL